MVFTYCFRIGRMPRTQNLEKNIFDAPPKSAYTGTIVRGRSRRSAQTQFGEGCALVRQRDGKKMSTSWTQRADFPLQSSQNYGRKQGRHTRLKVKSQHTALATPSQHLCKHTRTTILVRPVHPPSPVITLIIDKLLEKN